MSDHFEGLDPRECGEHRTTGPRAWCHVDHEWCYPDAPCRGCELPILRRKLEQIEAWCRTPVDPLRNDSATRLLNAVKHELLGIIEGTIPDEVHGT